MRIAPLGAVLLFVGPPLCSQNPDIEHTVESIQAAIQNGDQTGASRLLAGALARHPKEAGFLNLRGIIHAQRSELAEARADFQQAVNLSPSLMPAWQNLARACQLMTGGDSSAAPCAIAAWQHVLRARPSDVEARTALATIYEWQGQFADSLREVEKLPREQASRSALLALRCADLEGLHRSRESAEVAGLLVHAADFAEADAASIFPVLESSRWQTERVDSRSSRFRTSVRFALF